MHVETSATRPTTLTLSPDLNPLRFPVSVKRVPSFARRAWHSAPSRVSLPVTVTRRPDPRELFWPPALVPASFRLVALSEAGRDADTPAGTRSRQPRVRATVAISGILMAFYWAALRAAGFDAFSAAKRS